MEDDEYFGPTNPTPRDSLFVRPAGGGARDKAEELRRTAPVRTLLARALGVHTDERAWRRGARGEELVAARLAKLPAGSWFVFHDLPIGDRGANVDHLVIGPGGVFSLNTKNLTGKVWVAERTLLHNGRKTDYLPKARREGERVAGLLSTAVRWPVAVRPVVVVICDDFTVKAQPPDVSVVARRRITPWLTAQPAVLDAHQVFAIAAAADRPDTWR